MGRIAKNWDKAPVTLEKISDLVMDWRLYPRSEVDHQIVVRSYARALQAGANFPYIKVGLLDGKKIIVDGVHRVCARKLLKIDYVESAVLPFESEAALFAEAVRLNSSHGKGFTEAELKANIKRLQKYKFSIDDIQALVHVPAAEIYREASIPISVLTSPCGKKFHVDSKGKLKPGLSIREIVKLKNALLLCCSLAESGQIPIDEPTIKDLVTRCHLDFERLRNKVKK